MISRAQESAGSLSLIQPLVQFINMPWEHSMCQSLYWEVEIRGMTQTQSLPCRHSHFSTEDLNCSVKIPSPVPIGFQNHHRSMLLCTIYSFVPLNKYFFSPYYVTSVRAKLRHSLAILFVFPESQVIHQRLGLGWASWPECSLRLWTK